MFEQNFARMKDLKENQDGKYIKEKILLILKEQKVSLSQVRAIFNDILNKIEDENVITL